VADGQILKRAEDKILQ